MPLTEIETGRTYQVTDIFDKQQSAGLDSQVIQCMSNGMCVKMTPLTRIDLYSDGPSLTNPVCIIRGLLVALNNVDLSGVI